MLVKNNLRFFFCKSSFISVIVRCKLQILILNCFEQKRGICTQRLLHWLICSSFLFPSNVQLSKSPKSNRILNFRIFCAFIATQKHIKHIHHSPLVIYQYLHILHKFFGHYFIVHNVWKTSPVMGPWWVWTMQRFCHLFYLRFSKCATWVFFSPCYVFHLNKLFLEKNT